MVPSVFGDPIFVIPPVRLELAALAAKVEHLPSCRYRGQCQQLYNWCWAAVAAGVSLGKYSQPEIVMCVKGLECSTVAGPLNCRLQVGGDCDQGGDTAKAIECVGRFIPPERAPLSMQEVESALEACRENGGPIVAVLGEQHVVVIHGAEKEEGGDTPARLTLHLSDPQAAKWIAEDYQSFHDGAAGRPAWTRTILTGRKEEDE